MEISLH